MEKRVKTAQVNLRMKPNLKQAAEAAATDDHRSLTSLVEMLLTRHLIEHGYLGGQANKRSPKPKR